jgi:hypothetical protein
MSRTRPVSQRPAFLAGRWSVLAFVAWSAYVWVTRIVNALGDDTANKPFALALSLSVLVPVGAVGVTLLRARHRAIGGAEARLWVATAGWVSLVWLVRGVEIVLSEHEVGFKVVHVVIGVLSVVLAAATVRVVRRERAASELGRRGQPARRRPGSPTVGADR